MPQPELQTHVASLADAGSTFAELVDFATNKLKG